MSVGAATTTVDATLATVDFVECYRLHYGRMIRALRLAGADDRQAEDLAQEAFARTLVHWRRVQRGTNPPGYVYRTAFRLYARRVPQSDEPLPDAVRDPGADPATVATIRVGVEAALAAMPPRRRLCATLSFIVGMTTAETADALGIAEGTVRKQLDAARADLRTAL